MTSTFKGAETIVDAIVSKLQANMVARVASINTEKNDGITVTAPDNSRYYTAAMRVIAPGSPAVLVMDGPMSLDRGEGFHSIATVTRIGVYVRDEDFDEQHLARRLQRLSRAVIESLWDGTPAEQLQDGSGAQVAWRIFPEGTVPGMSFEPEGAQPGTALAAYYLTLFRVQRLEQ